MANEEIEVFYPKTKSDWRKWLLKNHLSKQSVWVVFYNKKSNKKSISWSDAVDVALCFGWIDSKKIKIDSEKSHQFFSKRKHTSTWSKINKDKIEKLTEQNLMAEAGFKSIEIAKQNGSWTILDEVEALIIPKDLELEFDKNVAAREFYESLSKSARKAILQWIILAKRAETRQARIIEIIEQAVKKQKPKHIQ